MILNVNVPSINYASTAVMELSYLFHTLVTNAINFANEV